MPPTKNRIGIEHQDKKLRVEFLDGEIAEIKVLLVSECEQHQECNGITYDIVSTNRPERAEKSAARWSDSANVKAFEVLGE